uniref:Uncharacterized protein n=1 Tax=Hucho hucho TaxID=62062 RepID=A0A4W5K7Y9_9TELE
CNSQNYISERLPSAIHLLTCTSLFICHRGACETSLRHCHPILLNTVNNLPSSCQSAEAACPGVKQESSEGEEDPRHIQTGAPPVAMEDPTTVPAVPRTRRSITEEEGPEVLLVKEGCEEGLGNPEGTMVMEDNQTTPPPESTEEPAAQDHTQSH